MNYGVIPESLIERLALWAGKVPVPALDGLVTLMKARAIMAGVSLGIFEALKERSLTAAEVASACTLDADCTEMLLRTLAHGGYLERDGERFALSALSSASMVRGGSQEFWGYQLWNYTQWHLVEHLEELVRTGRGLDLHHTLKDAEAWGHYQRAMLEVAQLAAPILARHVPVRRGATRLLDVAGSHGLLGAAICRRHPPMHSLVLDLPAALDAARALAAEQGLGDVVEHRAGDLTCDDLGEGHDVVLLANILHHFQPDANLALLRRVHAATRADGTVAIWEIEAPDRRRPPELGDGAALYFRLTSTAAAYSGATYADWLRQAGFERVGVRRPLTSPGSVLVCGRKP
jgi:2-polyprenyl-3-methyl-5-hydroxy-6-metoxy-1,4-benzoquinol methylase